MAVENPPAAPVPTGSLSEQIDEDLAAAQAAVAAEEAAALAAQQPPGTVPDVAAVDLEPVAEPAPGDATNEQPAADPPAAEAGQPGAPPAEQQPPRPTTVPYGRFAEVVEQRNRADQAYRQAVAEGTASQRQLALLQQQVAHLSGQVQGMQRAGVQPAGAPPARPQVDPLAEVEGQMLELAREYEGGTMRASEYEQKRIPLARRHAGLLAEMGAVNVTRAARQYDAQQAQSRPATGADLYLEDQTRLMEEANPWTRNVPPEVMADYKPLVERWCHSRNIPLTPDARGNRNLRAAFIALGKERGLDRIWGAPDAAPAAAPPMGSTAQTARLPAPPSQPPLIGNRGAAAPGAPGGISKEAFLAMSPEARLELPPHVLMHFESG